MFDLFYIIIGLGFGFLIFWFWERYIRKQSQQELKNEFAKISQDIIKNSQEQLLFLTKERLQSEKEIINSELDAKKKIIANLVQEIRRDLRIQHERQRKSDYERISSFSYLKQELENYKEITAQLKWSTDQLKQLLSNNQLRGKFGEQIAENLLKMAGFVIGLDYMCNKKQESQSSRPDFSIILPDKTKVNIDVKFPYNSLKNHFETQDKKEKDIYFKKFITDVKQKIKEISTKNYINPEDRTVDFVILFIPNEMIFSFIYEKMQDVWEQALKKKVILTGPFSFTAILKLIKQAQANFCYQKNLQQTIFLIQKFKIEFEKYNQELDILGEKIIILSKQYERVSGVRTRQLTRVIDQIENQKLLT